MNGRDRRRVERIDIPGHSVLDLGLWLDRTPEPLLAVRELGPPDLRSVGSNLLLQDLSPYGIRLRAAFAPPPALSPGQGLYMRLDLRAPWDAGAGRLRLFLFAWIVWRQPRPPGCALGLRIAAHARSEPGAKMFRLVEIQEEGLGELARWLGELARVRHACGLLPRPDHDMSLFFSEGAARGGEAVRLQ